MKKANRLLSVAAAATLCATMAMAGNFDYNGSVASFPQRDGNTTIVFKGDQNVKVENVYVRLDDDQSSDHNLTAGNKLFIELPEGVEFAQAPEVRAEKYIFKVNGQAARTKTAELTTDPDTGHARAVVTVDINSSNDSVVFRKIYLNIPSGYNSKELNVTFGSLRVSDAIPSTNSVKPLVAIVESGFPKNPILWVDGKDATNENTPVTMKRTVGVTDGNDKKDVTLLFKVKSGVVSGSVIDLKLPSWAKLTNGYPKVGVLTDKLEAVAADINATDVDADVSGADNNNTIRITLKGETKEVTEVNITIPTSDINIISTQPDGTNLDIIIDGNATLISAPSSFTFARLKSKGLIVDVNESADRNITKGALYAASLNPITIKTNFEHDWNDTNVTIALPAGTWLADANVTINTTTDLINKSLSKYVVVKDQNGNNISPSCYLKTPASLPSTPQIDLNLSCFDGNNSITIEANASVAAAFAHSKIPVTVKLTNTNDTIELRAYAATAQNGANAVDPEVHLETNETNKKVAIGRSDILRLDINESYYGSLQMKDYASTRYFIKGTSCANLNKASSSNANGGATNGLTLTNLVDIDKQTLRYDLTNESKGAPANTFLDINVSVPSDCQVGDPVKVKLVREDDKVIGEVQLATVGKPYDLSAVEVNVTKADEIAAQTLGTINLKTYFPNIVTTGGAFTITAPSGMQNLQADITGGNGLAVETNSTGLDGRAVVIDVTGAQPDANITLYAEVGNLSGVQAVNVTDGNVSNPNNDYEKKAGITNKSINITYVSADGNIPAPTLSASGDTEVPAGMEANITLSCEGTGLGTYSYSLDNADAPHITINGNIVTVAADAEAGEVAKATCTESFGGKTSAVSNEVEIKVVEPAPQEVNGSITLVQGQWNLITTPIPAPMPTSELSAYTDTTIWKFNSNKYLQYLEDHTTQPYEAETTSLEVGRGYWVFANKKGGALTYSAAPTVKDKTEQWTNIQNNFVSGTWNLLGTSFELNASEVKQMLNVNVIWTYDPSTPNTPWKQPSILSAGQGFWVK